MPIGAQDLAMLRAVEGGAPEPMPAVRDGWSGPPPDELHLLHVALALPGDAHDPNDARAQLEIAAGFALLSPAEQARAARRVVPRKRAQFVLARAALRRVLGQVLDVAPRSVALQVGVEGKPWHPEVAFNLSHSERVAIIAIAPVAAVAGGPTGEGARIGVDVEAFKPPDFAATRLEGMARRVLHPTELRAWLERDLLARREAFVRTWVRKEAVLKALGTGFTLPAAQLELVDHPAAAGAAPFRVHTPHPWHATLEGASAWRLRDGDDVELDGRYGVAVCWGGAALQVRSYAWSSASL